MKNKQNQVFNIIKRDKQSQKNINLDMPDINDNQKKTIKFKTIKTEYQNISPKNNNTSMDLEEKYKSK